MVAVSQRFRTHSDHSNVQEPQALSSYGAITTTTNDTMNHEQSSSLVLGNIQQQELEVPNQEGTVVEKPKRSGQDRMIALDVMRGMTIMLMIVVNNQPSTTFYPLDHAEWFGMTPTDLVFPFFLWVSGYAAGIVFRNEWKSDDISFFPCSEFWRNIQNYFRKLCGKIDYENLEEGQQWNL
ncbi:hypothetical protein C9374_002047 [Naegleria lovaniensis]|uniref:Heparan-alpha-glucosaminide N-acetyltransferase catalytic domain-containing protein n=1 Tax=Naegleria lovaniensis TaxID=51637 RepID=A0AA88KR42_NAELO|nr:uncharacterized protein C9374_002047 [Naegleria lovaniensis]KAG2387012.1 hypothetical protein C9374_002047 [Naegleria lovaniensis]